MTPVQRFGAVAVLVGGACVIAAALMFSVPLGLLVAGVLFVLIGSSVLRGAKP